MGVLGQCSFLDCELLEGRDAACFVIAFSMPSVVPTSHPLPEAQSAPALEEAAVSLECGGGGEERTSPGLLTDEHSID